MSKFTCEDVCAAVTWDHVQRQASVAALPFSVLAGVGLIFTVTLPGVAANARVAFASLEGGLSTYSTAAAALVTLAHFLECWIFLVRQRSQEVNPVYYSLEVMGSILVFLDVIAGWFFVCTGGTKAVIKGALFGRLATDVLVATSPFALIVEVPGREKTWFSFSFLASLRMSRIFYHLQKIDEYSNLSSWRKQLSYHAVLLMSFVYAAGVSIMTFEILQTPSVPADKWNFSAGASFMFSTMFTLGETSLTPRSLMGQMFAILSIFVGVHCMFTKVVPLMFDILFGRSAGLGAYRNLRRGPGHVVIVGTSLAPSLWEFLLEVYHPNHFTSGLEFAQEAPTVVILTASENTLAHLRMYLARREAIQWRDRVVPLLGEVWRPADLNRALLKKAQRVIVLPNFSTADVYGDDSSNVMRSLAIGSYAPHVPLTCLVHTAELRPSLLATTNGNCCYVCIDNFKLLSIAKACNSYGILALVCNLCKTQSDDVEEGLQPWQAEYERSLGVELYEVELVPAYDSLTFGEVFEDMLARSKESNVYLIGFTDGLEVSINPGTSYVLDFAAHGGFIAGVFLAPDLSAIIQVPRFDAPLMSISNSNPFDFIEEGYWTDNGPSAAEKLRALGCYAESPPATPQAQGLHSPTDATYRLSLASQFDDEPIADVSGTLGATVSSGGLRSHQSHNSRQVATISVHSHRPQRSSSKVRRPSKSIIRAIENKGEAKKRSKPIQDQHIPTGPDVWSATGYKDAMSSTRHKLLLKGGFDLKVVADVTKAGEKEPHKVAGNIDAEAKQVSQALRKRDIPEWPAENPERPVQQRFEELTVLYSAQEVAEQDAFFPPEPPATLLHTGNHLILAIVGDTTTTADDQALPYIDIEEFIRVMRDPDMTSTSTTTLVILSEVLPSDWTSVVHYDRLFWVKGSALNSKDLARAGFKQAKAIAIVRGHCGVSNYSDKVADARVLLAANLCEVLLPHDTRTQVITEHGYNGSCELLPKMTSPLEAQFQPKTCRIPNPGKSHLSYLLNSLSAGTGNTQARGTLGFAERTGDDLGLHSGPCDEDYEDLGGSEYVYHPRYMRGQVFVTSVMPALMANSLYNPELVPLVTALLRAPTILAPLPSEWERHLYADLAIWLFRTQQLLALGLYRSATASAASAKNKPLDDAEPTHHFVYTAPNAQRVKLIRTDRIICVKMRVPAGGA